MLMKKILAPLLGLLLLVPSAAFAIIITFDGGTPHPYTEAGYIFTLNGGSTPHFGDGLSATGILDWHDGGANAGNAIVTMTKSGGGLFDLNSLDVFTSSTATSLLINGLTLSAGSAQTVNLFGVSSVTFDFVSGSGGIDNLVINDVPEPSILALFGLGLAGLVGLRRRQKA